MKHMPSIKKKKNAKYTRKTEYLSLTMGLTLKTAAPCLHSRITDCGFGVTSVSTSWRSDNGRHSLLHYFRYSLRHCLRHYLHRRYSQCHSDNETDRGNIPYTLPGVVTETYHLHHQKRDHHQL